MRILMVGGNMHAMKDTVNWMAAPGAIVELQHHRNLVRMSDGSELHMCVISQEKDTEWLRGLTFDFVIEHSTFPRSMRLLQLVRALVLR